MSRTHGFNIEMYYSHECVLLDSRRREIKKKTLNMRFAVNVALYVLVKYVRTVYR